MRCDFVLQLPDSLQIMLDDPYHRVWFKLKVDELEGDDDDADVETPVHKSEFRRLVAHVTANISESVRSWGIGIDTFIKAKLTLKFEIPNKIFTGLRNHSYQLSKLCNELQYSDFSLMVKGREFGVHRAILAARSSFFAKMFATDMKEAVMLKAELKEIEPDTFEELLKYIYTGVIPESAEHLAMDLFAIADRFEVDGLKKACEMRIQKNLGRENALAVFTLTEVYICDNELKDKALELVIR